MPEIPADQAQALTPFGFSQRTGVVVVQESHLEGIRIVGYARPDGSPYALMETQRVWGLDSTAIIDSAEFAPLLERLYQHNTAARLQSADSFADLKIESFEDLIPVAEELLSQEGDAPIIGLINAIISQAIKRRASDIHFESYENRLSVRLRIDGVLKEVLQTRRELCTPVLSRLKVMARLDIAEKRLPQDGRIALRLAGREIDIRVSTMPTRYGERGVLRILDKRGNVLTLEDLGLQQRHKEQLVKVLLKPHGIVLVTGPTGSGKTTTLYAGLQLLNDGRRNIMTVEDPVEYELDGIAQTPVQAKAGMTFAKALRAILRQDPDVVMIGEVRDLETAEIAIQASLTGHLVLSTLHTNTAIGAITRLRDMGVPSYLIASSVVAVVAQRLVRRLCTQCRSKRAPSVEEQRSWQLPVGSEVFSAVGCEACDREGYRGRVAVYEIVVCDTDLQQLIHDEAAETQLTALWLQKEQPLREQALVLALEGVTSLDEVRRISE